MASNNKIRLIKIASEINIGKDTIVEFLRSKGFEIENKPTAILDEKMIDVVYDKFKREKKAAETQREKILKHKEIRRTGEKKKNENDADYSAEDSSILHEDDTKISADESSDYESHTSEPVENSGEESHKVETDESEHYSHTVEQVVESHDEKENEIVVSPEIVSKEISVNEEQVPAEDKIAPIADKNILNKPSDNKHSKKNVVAQDDSNLQEDETIKLVKEALSVGIGILEQPKNVISLDDPDSLKDIIIEDIADDDPKTEAARELHRRKKKKKKLIEVQPGEAPQLRGLTIVGRIDIQAEKAKTDKLRDKKKRKVLPVDEEDIVRDDKTQKIKKKKVKGKETEVQQTTVAETADKTGNKFPLKKDDKKRKKRKKSIRESISQEEVEKAIRQTLSGMEGHGNTSRNKMRQRKKAEREEKEIRDLEEKERDLHVLKLTEFVTTSDLANLMHITANEIILKCMGLGLMVTINQRLDQETITLIADDYGFDVEFIDELKVQAIEEEIDLEETLLPRPPIVTIMGHVDHGKTSLLDHIRKANVVSGEAGGITQHIGAYRVKLIDGRSVTFLDTPGHEAFTAMRARGAQVTDIVVLVVAADDSVMPQTIEAISHAKAANVPIVVAINKIDKPDANPDRIRQQLTDYGVLVEEWGGKNQSVEISAKKGLHIDKLLEKILLEAELLELKANPDRKARGAVVESNMSKGWGAVATIIVQKGTLQVGDPFVAGVHSGKVRAMLDENGNKVEIARPSHPVLVIGFDGLPAAGDTFISVNSDVEARQISNERKQLKREQELRQVHLVTLDEISAQIQLGGVRDLNLVIKGDVAGSVEAISDSLLKLSREEVRVNILHKGVGSITETDIMLAAASQAVVIGFNVSPTGSAKKAVETEKVDVRHYDIIYDCINEIQLALEGMLKPEFKEEITSSVEVRKTFKISRMGTIAGCYVLSGKITRNDKVRVLRNGLPVFEGTLSSLKRNKDDAKEVDQGFECGIQLHGFNDFEENDIIEGFKMIEIKRSFR